MALLEPKTYRPTRSKRSALPEPNFYKTTSGKRFTEENVDYAIRISPGPADNMEWESTKVVELSTDPMEWAGNALHKGFNWASKWSTMSGSSFLPGETGDDGHGKPVSPHVWRDTWEMEGQAANVIEDPRTSDPRPNSSPQRIERHTRTWTIPLTARPTHPGSGDTIAEKRGKKTRTEENRLLEDIIRASYSSSSSAATSATVISDGEHEPQEISKRPGKGHWWDEWGLLQWVATLWLFGFLAAAALLYAANSSRWSYTGHTYYDFADNDYESEHYLGRSALGRAIFRIGSTLAFTWQGVVEAVTVFFDRYSALTWIRIAATRSISSLASTRISIAVSVFLSKLPFTWKEVVAAILCTPPARIAMAASTIAVLAEIIHYQAGYLTGLWYYILFYLIHFQNLVQRELGLQEDTPLPNDVYLESQDHEDEYCVRRRHYSWRISALYVPFVVWVVGSYYLTDQSWLARESAIVTLYWPVFCFTVWKAQGLVASEVFVLFGVMAVGLLRWPLVLLGLLWYL